MAKANPTEELIRFLLFVFWLPTAHSARAWGAEGAHYVRRGGKENAVREAEARTAETSRSAATTAGSQVQNTGYFSRLEKSKPAAHIPGMGLKAVTS